MALRSKPRFVIALIKHETNTFSPIETPLSKFGHGLGPAFGQAALDRFVGTNSAFAAFVDVAVREGAEVITPVAAESWPSAAATRATFEALVRPLEAAVRAGCDALFLDLHGAMVIEDCDDAEGELLRRMRAIAPTLPIAVTFDYHTNFSAEIARNATVITGYKTYPHIDIYDAGKQAAEILVKALRGEVKPVIAWGWKPVVPSIMRHAPEDGPSGEIIRLAREREASGAVLAATLLPAFAHADTPYTGLSVVVVGDAMRKNGARLARETCDAMLEIGWQRRAEYTYTRTTLSEDVSRARLLGQPFGVSGAKPDGPVLLIDHCDNCGSGGAQDVMTVVEEILRQGLDDIAIAPILDAAAVTQMVAAGVGNSVTLDLGGKMDMPAIGLKGRPLRLSGRVKTITDGNIVFRGPMYTGLKSQMGTTAVLATQSQGGGEGEIVITSLPHEPFDLVVFRSVGIEPTKKRYLMLKSRIHYRAGFKPIASHIVECQGEGVTNADLSVYQYKKLTRPIYPLDRV